MIERFKHWLVVAVRRALQGLNDSLFPCPHPPHKLTARMEWMGGEWARYYLECECGAEIDE